MQEAIAVQGELTGVWRFACPHCGKTHYQKTAIKRCADRLAHVLLGNDVKLQLHVPGNVNSYEAMKHGLSEEYNALLSVSGSRVFEMPVEVFTRAESKDELVLLMLQEFSKFVAETTAAFAENVKRAEDLAAKINTTPCVSLTKMTRKKTSWGHVDMLNGEELDHASVVKYFARHVPDPDIRARLVKHCSDYDSTLYALIPDEDIALIHVAGHRDGEKATTYGIRLLKDKAKVVEFTGAGANETQTMLKEMRRE